LVEVLEDVEADLRGLIASMGARVEAHALPVVTANRHQVRALLRNVIENAIRFGGDAPTIHLSADREERAWRVLVQDDGPGIGPKL